MHKYFLLALLKISIIAAKHYLIETKDPKTKSKIDYENLNGVSGARQIEREVYQDYMDEDYQGDDYMEDVHIQGNDYDNRCATGDYKKAERSKGEGCRIHPECDFGEVCSKEGKCERITCKSTQDCERKVSLPTLCLAGVCSSNTYCKSNAQCRKAGKDLVCENKSGQCKPQYGDCETTCDCLDNYGMMKGEAVCVGTGTFEERERVCLCRSDDIWFCGGNKTVTSTPPTSPKPNKETTTQKPTTTKPTTTAPSVCPPVPSKDPGAEGGQCLVHSGCWHFLNLICLIRDSTGQEEKGIGQDSVLPGICKKVQCKKDGDCKKKTSLPSMCRGGLCSHGYCYHDDDCPKGYGCAAGYCKVKFGSCEYDCDCGPCHIKSCINKTCYCKSKNDDCEEITKLEKKIPDVEKVTCVA